MQWTFDSDGAGEIWLQDVRFHCEFILQLAFGSLRSEVEDLLWGSQNGTRSTRFGRRVAQPWMNLLN